MSVLWTEGFGRPRAGRQFTTLKHEGKAEP
jgi:hypothetical protein